MDQIIASIIVIVTHVVGMYIAAHVICHPDWVKAIKSQYSPWRAFWLAIGYVLMGWVTVLIVQRKWIIKEIKYKIDIWRKLAKKKY